MMFIIIMAIIIIAVSVLYYVYRVFKEILTDLKYKKND